MSKQTKAMLVCPQCGHQQLESTAAFSANCKGCGQYWRVQELLKPASKAPAPAPEQRRIICFDCATELDVPASAQSTMCKRCSCYIDLHNYSIANAVSRNFKTKGSLVIEPTGYLFNSEALVRDAVVKGRFIGKLVVERSLALHSSANIKGEFTAGQLIVPAAQQFRWAGQIKVGSAEIDGELTADLEAQSLVHVNSKGRLFGNIHARSLIAEKGAILIIEARIGAPEAG